MRTYGISKGNASIDVTELDVKHLLNLVRKDIKYLKSRSAARRVFGRNGGGGDANASKITSRQALADKLAALQKERP